MSDFLVENLSSLVLDDGIREPLLLTDDTTDDQGNTFSIVAFADEGTWDNPQPIDVAVQRWMTDGAVASTQGQENRQPYFKATVSADDSVALAAAESALVKRSNRQCLLTWTPPEGDPIAPSSVFEVWTWHLEHILDELDEMRLRRTYGLRFTAAPWTRSVDLTTVPALPTVSVPTVTEVDDCTSLTHWTGSPNTATLSGTGAIHETKTVTKTMTGVVLSLKRVATVSMTGTPFLLIDSAVTGVAAEVNVTVDGVALTRVSGLGNLSWWAMPAGVTSFTTLVIKASIRNGTQGSIILSVADVSKTDSPGGVGSHKQLLRHMDVGGSVPTSGSLQIASPSSTALGNVLVYTCADDGSGYNPCMRGLRTSGNTVTTDSAAVSGAHEALCTGGTPAGTITYTVPPGQLPEGTYAVLARLLFGAAATITVTVTAKVAGGVTTQIVGKVGALGSGAAWGCIGVISLPTQAMPDASQLTTIVTLSAVATTGTHTIDELYLLNVSTGAVTLVLKDASNFTQLRIDAPDVDRIHNLPALYTGTQADWSDAVSPAYSQTVLSFGDHRLDPDGVSVLTVTDGVNDAVVTGSFYHRWHTHAAD